MDPAPLRNAPEVSAAAARGVVRHAIAKGYLTPAQAACLLREEPARVPHVLAELCPDPAQASELGAVYREALCESSSGSAGIPGLPNRAPSPEPSAPQRIGQFEILSELARGGMGVVYRGRDPALDRPVAVKVLLESGAGDSRQRRFQRELEGLARLQHPNIVRIHTSGLHAGRPYLVMDLIEGRTLQERLEREGPLPIRAAVEVCLQLADALALAHAAGIVHRDVKPDNVLMGSEGQPLLTDFGLVKDLNAAQEKALTLDGSPLGTPGYWPPEQARGDLDAVGPASDVYSLGAVLYETLTGQVPNRGESLIQIMALLEQPPLPPSDLRPEVDAELERICLTCLERDPAQRYASATELAEELRDYLGGSSRTASRRLAQLAALGLVLAAGLAAGALAGGGSDAPPQEEISPASPSPRPWRVELAEAQAAGDEAQTLSLLQAAAEQGHPEPIFALAERYAQGRGIARDLSRAAGLYARAADEGHALAMFRLGACHENGLGVARSDALAAQWYRQAAEAELPQGMRGLGLCLEHGRGVAQDARQAVSWYRKAAQAGDAKAMADLGVCLFDGKGTPRSPELALKWWRKAVAKGYMPAATNVGVCYADGSGVEQSQELAAEWYRKAADAGDPGGMYNLALCYTAGRGVPRDADQEAYWLLKAAEAGHRGAMSNLAVGFLRGRGVEQDPKQAVYWLRKAAKAGHPGAMHNLAFCLKRGHGARKDPRRALFWYRQALEVCPPSTRPKIRESLRGLLAEHPQLAKEEMPPR